MIMKVRKYQGQFLPWGAGIELPGPEHSQHLFKLICAVEQFALMWMFKKDKTSKLVAS